MRRPVEPHITILLCIPSGLHPSMNALARFAAHQPFIKTIPNENPDG
jgi:hypothetical protein